MGFPQSSFGPPLFRNDCCDGHGHDGNHAHECLQEDQRLVLCPSHKRTVAVHGPVNSHRRQQAGHRHCFTLAQSERRPEYGRDAQEGERAIPDVGGEPAAKLKLAHEDQHHQNQDRLESSSLRPVHARIRPP